MLVHQYEFFKMKDDESIEEMYSRFQTLVSGLQILKKRYVASDHESKILRSLPARWCNTPFPNNVILIYIIRVNHKRSITLLFKNFID